MNIEEYIRKNRLQLDADKADEDFIWNKISGSIMKPKKQNRFLIFKIAASIIVVVALSLLTYQIASLRTNQKLILANIDPELAKQEAQFQNQIKNYYQLIKNTSFDEELLTTDFKDLEYIDTLINKYSVDLAANGPNPRLLNSLMDLYQKKIKLLDRMLNEIEKNKRYENSETNI